MKKLILILLVLCSGPLSAQEIYVVTVENELKIIDVNSFEVTDLFTIPIEDVGFITDIAFTPSGQLFGVTSEESIIEIDLVEEDYTLEFFLSSGSTYTALVSNTNNDLYTSKYLTQELITYNVDTQQITSLANNISTPGDFTFYKGHLVYPGLNNDFIKAYDGTTITNIGCSVPQIWTFVNDFQDCDNNTIYAIDNNGVMYRYDLETENYEFLFDFQKFVGSIYGGATMTEYLASDCILSNLEETECNLGIDDSNPYGITIKTNPVKEYLEIVAEQEGDLSFQLYSLQGKVALEGAVGVGQIPASTLSSGVYFLMLTDEASGTVVFQEKIMKN